MRIGLIVSDLGMGGAQRVLVLLSNAWVSRGHAVSILCLDDGRRPSFFELDSRVGVVHVLPDAAPPENGFDGLRGGTPPLAKPMGQYTIAARAFTRPGR